MKNLTIQFAGYGIQDETAFNGYESAEDLLRTIAADGAGRKNSVLFDYETGTKWRVVNVAEKDKQISELKTELEKVKAKLKETEQERFETRNDYRYFKNLSLSLKEQLKNNTKQVCEKIRKSLDDKVYTVIGCRGVPNNNYVQYKAVVEILDQIERGEK